ncbi:MAG: hypothetical protein WCJ64_08445 [Rhodospirillaceae bacterium]
MWKPIVMVLMTALSACAECPAQLPAAVCPQVPAYSQDQRAALAEEIDHAPPNSALVKAATEYTKVRAALRGCHES